jgi:hypothetical protein
MTQFNGAAGMQHVTAVTVMNNTGVVRRSVLCWVNAEAYLENHNQ